MTAEQSKSEWEPYEFWYEGKRYHTMRSNITGEFAIPRGVVQIAGKRALDVIMQQLEDRDVSQEGG